MSAGDDDGGPKPDPWDEIVAGDLGDDAGETAFRFDDIVAETPAQAEPPEAASPSEPDLPADPEATGAGDTAENALIDDWLTGGDADAEGGVPPLSVFAPDEPASGSSNIDIGTGASGVGLHGAPDQEEIGDETALDTSGVEQADANAWPGIAVEGAGDDAGGLGDFAMGAAAAAVAAGASSAAPKKIVRRPVKATKKASGFGQLVGIVMGALLAFPIVLGVLIAVIWLGGPDPCNLRHNGLAFMLPAKSAVAKTPAGEADGGGESALDNLPAAAGEPAADAVAESADPMPADQTDDSSLGDIPVPEDLTAPVDGIAAIDEPAPADATASPEASVPEVDMPADPAPATDLVEVDVPGLDALDAPAEPAAAPEPPPLDTAALDGAVVEAETLGRALGLVDDKDGDAYLQLRARWYRALARVAEELVTLENTAATSGRPLAAAPDSVTALHGGIGGDAGLVAELAALAPDWLAYGNRRSDGVVLPVTFGAARRVGPYWSARVSLVGSDGTARDITVISRSEPVAVAGDRLVVTGLALDGGVVWAADVHRRDGAAGVPGVGGDDEGGDLSAGF